MPDTLHYVSLGDRDDRIREATDETEIIDGGAGNDRLIGRGGNDVLDGGSATTCSRRRRAAVPRKAARSAPTR